MANDEERKFRLRAARKPVRTKRTPGGQPIASPASLTPASQKGQGWRSSKSVGGCQAYLGVASLCEHCSRGHTFSISQDR
jgi:hypothetical protein